MKKLKKRKTQKPKTWLDQVSDLYEQILLKPDDPAPYLSLTALLEEHKRYEEALELYSQGLRKMPNQGLLQMNYGLLLYKLGEVESGRTLMNVARDLLTSPDPEEVKALRSLKSLGQTQIQSQRFQLACKTYAEIVRLDPDNPGTQYVLASLFQRLKLYQDARRHYQRVLALASAEKQPDILAQTYWHLALLSAHEGREPDFYARYEQDLRLNPQLTPPFFHFAHVIESVAVKEALQRYDFYLTQKPEDPHKALILARMAQLWRQLGQPEVAADCLSESLRIDPDCVLAWYQQGFLKAEAGAPSEAVWSCFEQVFALQPQAALFRTLQAVKREAFEPLLTLLKPEQALTPERQGVLGLISLQAGNWTEAVQAFENLLAQNVQDDTLQLKARVFLAAALQGLGGPAELEQAQMIYQELKASTTFAQQPVLLSLVCQNLAQILASQEMSAKEAELYARDREYHPDLSPEFFHFTRLMESGEDAECVQKRYEAYLAANPQEPNRAPILCHLGMALRKQRKLDEAIEIFEAANNADVSCVLTYFQMSILQVEMEFYKGLRTWIKKAEQFYPDPAKANVVGLNQFYALSWLENPPELLQQYHTYKEGNQQALFELSISTNAWQAEGQFQKVIMACNQFLKKHPKQVEIIALKARMLSLDCRYQESFEVLQPVIEAGFLHGDVAEVYAMDCLHTKRFDEESKAYLYRILAEKHLHFFYRRKILFQIGQMYDKAKQPEQAFEYFVEGNALKSQSWNPQKHDDIISVLMQVLNRENIAKCPRGNHSARPVFVVGMPRSGTTLTEQILCSHPDVFGAGEDDHLQKVFVDLLGVEEARLWRNNKTNAAFVKNHSQRLTHLFLNFSPERLAAAAEDYLNHMESTTDRKGYAYIVNKMPGNFQYLGLIELLFPKAIILHCCRHPLDTCLSCFSIDFKELKFTNHLEHLGRYYGQYQRIMQHWKRELEIPILDVHYEETIADQEAMSRRLIAHLGLEWDERCLSFYKTDRHVKTASYEQVRKPIYTTSVARYKPYERFLEPLKTWIDLSEWDAET